MKKNVLITGAGGFIGSSLCISLQKQFNIYGIDNFKHSVKSNLKDLDPKKSKIIDKDILKLNLSDLPKKIDIIIHLAAISSLPECQNDPSYAYKVNVIGTIKILELARNFKIKKFIFSSTSAVYENNLQNIFQEKFQTDPDLIYSMTKKNCETILKSYSKNYGIPITILRFFNSYGPRMDNRRISPPLISYIIKEISKNKIPILHSSGNQKRDYIYIDDIISLIMKIIKKNKKNNFEVLNVSSKKTISVKLIYNIISSKLNFNKKPKYKVPTKFWFKYDNLNKGYFIFNKNRVKKEVNKYSLGDNSLVLKKYNWKPTTDIFEGINKTINFYKKNF